MNELVIMKNHEAICDSLQVAEKFHKRHDNVVQTIRGLLKNEDTHKMFILSNYVEEQNGQTYSKYFMNRDGFSLLAMGFTGKDALQWKLQYIKAFNAMEDFIKGHRSQTWQSTRIESKKNRRMETDEIKTFVAYAIGNGSHNADRYYCNFSKLANKAVGIEPDSRNEATISQLNNLILIEHIIGQVIMDGVKQKLYYKDIFQSCKKRIEQFREIAFLQKAG